MDSYDAAVRVTLNSMPETVIKGRTRDFNAHGIRYLARVSKRVPLVK